MTTRKIAPQGYSITQIALHWAAAVLIARQYIFKDAIWQLVLRLTRGVPAAPQNEPAPLNPS